MIILSMNDGAMIRLNISLRDEEVIIWIFTKG